MHVVLISACEKRALKRSRAILDSYALRAGERAWATPITLEGLQELRAALKRTASRHTAVACYRNEGMRRMCLLWIVGSARHFGPHGHFPAGTTRRKKPEIPSWIRYAALLADAAGQGHDVGKASKAFQLKLRDFKLEQKDSLRHEWVSLKIIQALRTGADWDTAWRRLETQPEREGVPFDEHGLTNVFDAFDFLVVSHHGLFGPRAGDAALSAENHVRSTPAFELAQYRPHAELPVLSLALLHKKLRRLEKITPPADVSIPLYWRALSLIARAGLILADHAISSLTKTKAAELYANTQQIKGQNHRPLNQPLDQHLSDVSSLAGRMTYRLGTLRLPGLSPEAVERIMERTTETRFLWQNRAANALENARRNSQRPALVLNLAGTGTGKTRMNAKCACALAGERLVRFATALNLRTLSLQTGMAYHEQFNLDWDELACVIGDQSAVQTLKSGLRSPVDDFADEDENPQEAEFETFSHAFFVPEWVEPFIKRKPKLRPVIGAPILVSTVDFLIAAGEPHRQGHHALALLRLVDSDLILDEIDSYDPKALVAVLRLVQLAGLFGRNVIASSATLARPVAFALSRAYRNGMAMRAALDGRTSSDFLCALIDDRLDPEVFVAKDQGELEQRYNARIDRLLGALHGEAYRIPWLARVSKPGIAAWQDTIQQAVVKLHDHNAWPFAQTGKRVSFGLVRIANIRPAVEVACYLAKQLPNAHVACYHAADLKVQRFMKERTLDRLLTRKKLDDEQITGDPDIRERVARTDAQNVIFIVVATPVEEIGRDHDFDWAVIEPSSTQSIVQTAGRVNRHRLLVRSGPNIALLQANFRKIRGKSPIAFTRPGLETKEMPYIDSRYGRNPRGHNLAYLIDWNRLSALDAGLRFRDHPFARLDDENLTSMLAEPLKILCMEAKPRAWMVEATYENYPLRDQDEIQQTWLLTEEDKFKLWERKKKGGDWVEHESLVTRSPTVANAWLTWTREDLATAALNYQIDEPFELKTQFCKLADRGFEWHHAFGASQPTSDAD